MCINTINRLLLQCTAWSGWRVAAFVCVPNWKSLVTKQPSQLSGLLQHKEQLPNQNQTPPPPRGIVKLSNSPWQVTQSQGEATNSPRIPFLSPNLRLARYVNIADRSPYAQAPSVKNHYCSEISKINADLLIHYYLLYLYIYGNCWKWSSW